MSFEPGKGSAFKLDNLAGALQTLTDYITSISFPRNREMLETTTFGKDSRTYIPGLNGASISVSGHWDPTIDAQLAALLAATSSSTFEYGPQGASSGDVKYSGECFVTAYEPPSSVDGLAEFSLELMITGDVTRGTFA